MTQKSCDVWHGQVSTTNALLQLLEEVVGIQDATWSITFCLVACGGLVLSSPLRKVHKDNSHKPTTRKSKFSIWEVGRKQPSSQSNNRRKQPSSQSNNHPQNKKLWFLTVSFRMADGPKHRKQRCHYVYKSDLIWFENFVSIHSKRPFTVKEEAADQPATL